MINRRRRDALNTADYASFVLLGSTLNNAKEIDKFLQKVDPAHYEVALIALDKVNLSGITSDKIGIDIFLGRAQEILDFLVHDS